MSIWTIIFLVFIGICALGIAAAYRSDKKHNRSDWDFEDTSFAIFICTLITIGGMFISGMILAVVAAENEGEIVDTYKAELLPMTDNEGETLVVNDDNYYEFSFLRENNSPVKIKEYTSNVTIIDYDGEPYVVQEQWMGPDNFFPWEWQRWDEMRYVIYTDAETAPLVAE